MGHRFGDFFFEQIKHDMVVPDVITADFNKKNDAQFTVKC